MACDPFDVVVVPFPFTDRQAAKRRPALVVSATGFNRAHGQAILCMITSSGGPIWPSDVAIGDWREAGLHVPCRIRFKLFTLDDALILRGIGRLSERDALTVGDALGRCLAGGRAEPGGAGGL